jgi:hypothetical protein
LLADCLLRQRPGRWFGNRFSEHPSRFKVCPNGRVGLCQGFLVAHPPGRTVLKVGYTGNEAVVLLAPEDLYCVPIIWFSHRATSFPQSNPLQDALNFINIQKSGRRQGESAEKQESQLLSLSLYYLVSLQSTDRLIARSIILSVTFRYLRSILILGKETGGTVMLLSEKVLLVVGGPMATVMTLAASALAIL